MTGRSRIVVLDGHTLNPGDLTWSAFESMGSVEVHERTSDADRIARAAGAAILLTNKAVLDRGCFERLDALRYVGVLATGHDVVDLAAATDHGVAVTNVPAYGTSSVAQMTFALLLEMTNQTSHHAAVAREGRWSDSGEFSCAQRPMTELAGLTIGLVGLGRIGSAVARIARAFGMRVLVARRQPQVPQDLDIELVGLDALFERSDVVSLHCPLTDQTRQLVSAQRLSRMRSGAYLINTSRGGLLDEAAVAAALRQGTLAGAGLDVLATEPPQHDHPLLSAPNCTVTPHIAWATRASRARLMESAAANLAAFLAGTPRNLVSGS